MEICECDFFFYSGETAFKSMTSGIGWAKYPMIKRIDKIPQEVPMTFIYGEKSWIDKWPGRIAKSIRKGSHVNNYVRYSFFFPIFFTFKPYKMKPFLWSLQTY